MSVCVNEGGGGSQDSDVTEQLFKLNNNMKKIYENNKLYSDTTGYYRRKGDS